VGDVTLCGKFVRLEPLNSNHLEGLVAAAAEDRSIYGWTFVPQGKDETALYIETARRLCAAGKALPFATVRIADDAVLGSTRFFDLETWAWPEGHQRHGHAGPDVCEIGYTWLARSATRTVANTEAKLLMLAHAFENWQTVRLCLHTDARNARSRAAMERIGARFEGILRGHRMAADFTARDSARYSIVADEWSAVKERLERLRDRI
jgi:N-acetyltransferase